MVGCCPSVVAPRRADVKFLSERDGVYRVSASATAKTLDLAIQEAEMNALDVLFYRGLPSSQQNLAMIGIDEQKAKNDNREYFKQFYEGQRYRSFITDSKVMSSIDNDGCSKQVEIVVGINIQSLRIDLENGKVIRKLGY